MWAARLQHGGGASFVKLSERQRSVAKALEQPVKKRRVEEALEQPVKKRCCDSGRGVGSSNFRSSASLSLTARDCTSARAPLALNNGACTSSAPQSGHVLLGAQLIDEARNPSANSSSSNACVSIHGMVGCGLQRSSRMPVAWREAFGQL